MNSLSARHPLICVCLMGMLLVGCKGINNSSSSQSASSSSATASLGELVFAVNSGTSTPVNFDGIEYGADRYWSGGKHLKSSVLVNDSSDFVLYQTARSGTFQYQIPVSSARYSVVLHFNEYNIASVSPRIFSVYIEENLALTDLNLFEKSGRNIPWRHTEVNVAVTDGYLSIGFEANQGSPTINGFAIYSDNGGKLVPPPTPPLATLGQPQTNGIALGETKYLGNAMGGQVAENYIQYWNHITLESLSVWANIESYRGTMDWSTLDLYYSYARDHGLMMHHFFLSQHQQPAWISNLRGEITTEIQDWMRSYCERYPEPAIITVVNEPFNSPPNYRQYLGGDGETGWDWVVWSYQQARNFCPNAHLIIDEYEVINDVEQLKRYKQLIAILAQRNLIDGVGLVAASASIENLSAAEINENLDSLAELGLPIHITAMEIRDTQEINQRDKYAELFPVIWEHSAVAGVTLWGYQDFEIFGFSDTYQLIKNGTAKPAFNWLLEYFEQRRSNAVN